MHPGHHCIADRNRIRSSRLRRKSTVRRWCRFSGSPAQPIQSSASGSGLGCSVSDTSDVSFGPGEAPSSDGVTCSHAYLLLPPTGFAAAGGGVWAMQWTSAGIFIWRFTRSSIPSDISSGTPDSSKWGTPFAAWPASTCSPTKYFADMNLVFDITLCGDWAGDQYVWNGSGAPSKYKTCQDVVGTASLFDEAYFEVNYVKSTSLLQSLASLTAPDSAPAQCTRFRFDLHHGLSSSSLSHGWEL